MAEYLGKGWGDRNDVAPDNDDVKDDDDDDDDDVIPIVKMLTLSKSA